MSGSQAAGATEERVHLSGREWFRAWRERLSALRRVLCLTDPWVPAFAGTAVESTET